MKKMLLVLLLITSVIMGQGLSIFSGLSVPLGDFGDVYSPGMQYGLGYLQNLPDSKMEGMEGTKIKSETLITYAMYQGETNATYTKREYMLLTIETNGILDMNPSAKDFGGLAPTAQVGASYGIGKSSGVIETDSYIFTYENPEELVGLNIGGGADYYLNKNFYLGAAVKYHYIIPLDEYDTGSMSLFDIRLGAGISF